MDANIFWKLCMETGSPQAYLLYKETKVEAKHVSDDSGNRSQSNRLQ